MKAATTISGHLKDLGRRDVQVVIDVAKWLESTTNDARDISHRTQSKRLGFRLVAANLLIKAFQGDVAACREIMDRTEGKVADVVIQGNFDDLVRSLEMGRQRLLTPQPAIEGELAVPHLVVDSASPIAEDSHPVTDPTESTPSK